MQIGLKRAYDAVSESDGHRVLVDRIWPRGVLKSELGLDTWNKDVAPSSDLRRWFNHDPTRWDEFKQRYFQELDRRRDAVEPLLMAVRSGPVTLIYGAKDERHNNAVALKEYIEGQVAS